MNQPESWAYPEAWRREEALCQSLIDLRRALLEPGAAWHVPRLSAALLRLLGQEAGATAAAETLRLLLAAWRLRPSQSVTLHLCRLLDQLRQQAELQARLYPLQEPLRGEPPLVLASAR